MRYWTIAISALLIATPTLAQQMNAETFYQRATALKSMGALAIFSGGEVKALSTEAQAASQAASARLKADKAAGHPARVCAPPGHQKIGSDEFMARLGAIPQAERAKIDMTEATTRVLAAKFPCPR